EEDERDEEANNAGAAGSVENSPSLRPEAPRTSSSSSWFYSRGGSQQLYGITIPPSLRAAKHSRRTQAAISARRHQRRTSGNNNNNNGNDAISAPLREEVVHFLNVPGVTVATTEAEAEANKTLRKEAAA